MKSARLAGMLISLIPAFLLMAFIGGVFVKKYSARVSEHIAAATSIAAESLSNLQVVHAFDANVELENVFAAHLRRGHRDGVKKIVISGIQLGLLFFIAYSANALAFWQGSVAIASSVSQGGNGTTIGGVYTVIFLLVDASFMISQVAPFLQIFGSAAGASEKLLRTTTRQPRIDGTSGNLGNVSNQISGQVDFRNVIFSYPSRPHTRVLQEVSFSIPANKHTAIVGLSGSGKSTIAALLERLYDPDSGVITLDGIDLREYNLRYIRGFIGMVQQEPTLLDRSILENIAHGLVGSSREEHIDLNRSLLGSGLANLAESIRNGKDFQSTVNKSSDQIKKIMSLVERAARLADALAFIDCLPHGLATTVGAIGSQLSGGQKQRVSLARALVREPKILLLDEATAALDSASEMRIQASLDAVHSDRTTISIAHRLSTVKTADNLIVFREGRIVEQGSPVDLMESGGEYSSMLQMQSVDSAAGSSQSSSPIPEDITTPTVQDIVRDQIDSLNNTTEVVVEIEGDKSALQKVKPIPSGLKAKTPNLGPTGSRPLFSTCYGIIAMTRPQLLIVIIGLFSSIIVGGAYSGEAVIFGQTVGNLSPCRGAMSIESSGRLFGLLFFLLGLVEFAANLVNVSAFGFVSEKLLFKVRVLSLRTLLSQEIQWHESNGRNPATSLSYISGDANALAGLTGTLLGVLLSIVVNLITGIVLSHVVAWKIAIVLLATLPVLLGSGFMRLRVLAQFHERHQKAFASSVSITVEAVKNIRTIATFSLERECFAVYQRSLREPYRATIRAIALGNMWLATAYSISNLVYALAYWWGARQVISGFYSPTQFFTVLPALLFSAQACGQMFSLAPDLSKARVAAARVLDLLDQSPNDGASAQTNANLDRFLPCEKSEVDIEAAYGLNENCAASIVQGTSVAFRDVHFTYPARPTKSALCGLNIEVQPGEFCALVGSSGAGKSTIIALLERFYRPDSGTVEIDGRDISSYEGADFRHDIALVPQDSTLFEGTLRFNLALGARPTSEVTDANIESVCRFANIHDTISALPDGYNTTCGPNGSHFSGGQKQRLSIARALLRKPRLLLLDECTSALDAEAEALLQDTLERIGQIITVIAVAHRLHTIQRATRIFLIESGRCVDSGTHTELLGRSRVYRETANYQNLDG
ncbi:MAG: hypothetical protein M1825_001002 [Sarcosagium campestre]|nr:MAG: hypothetical protein M1825_001002 [Sarcosagium campestre]